MWAPSTEPGRPSPAETFNAWAKTAKPAAILSELSSGLQYANPKNSVKAGVPEEARQTAQSAALRIRRMRSAAEPKSGQLGVAIPKGITTKEFLNAFNKQCKNKLSADHPTEKRILDPESQALVNHYMASATKPQALTLYKEIGRWYAGKPVNLQTVLSSEKMFVSKLRDALGGPRGLQSLRAELGEKRGTAAKSDTSNQAVAQAGSAKIPEWNALVRCAESKGVILETILPGSAIASLAQATAGLSSKGLQATVDALIATHKSVVKGPTGRRLTEAEVTASLGGSIKSIDAAIATIRSGSGSPAARELVQGLEALRTTHMDQPLPASMLGALEAAAKAIAGVSNRSAETVASRLVLEQLPKAGIPKANVAPNLQAITDATKNVTATLKHASAQEIEAAIRTAAKAQHSSDTIAEVLSKDPLASSPKGSDLSNPQMMELAQAMHGGNSARAIEFILSRSGLSRSSPRQSEGIEAARARNVATLRSEFRLYRTLVEKYGVDSNKLGRSITKDTLGAIIGKQCGKRGWPAHMHEDLLSRPVAEQAKLLADPARVHALGLLAKGKSPAEQLRLLELSSDQAINQVAAVLYHGKGKAGQSPVEQLLGPLDRGKPPPGSGLERDFFNALRSAVEQLHSQQIPGVAHSNEVRPLTNELMRYRTSE